MKLFKKSSAKAYSSLMIAITFASDNRLQNHLKIFWEECKNVIMTIEHNIRDQKLQYNINKGSAK